NRSPPASNPKPCATSTRYAEPATRPAATTRSTPPVKNPHHGRPSRQGRRFRHRPAPDDNPYLNEKDTHNDQHRTSLDDMRGPHPAAGRTCRPAFTSQHRSPRRLHGLRRQPRREVFSATSAHPTDSRPTDQRDRR